MQRARIPQRPMTDEEIADVVAAYVRSATSAMAVGFDGIALHGAHGYMIDGFFWHVTNHRQDRWGGATLARRAAFGAEVVRAIRAAIGAAPMMFRFSQWKLHDYAARNANTPAELEQMLGPLSDAGVDIFDASTRRFAAPAFENSPLTLAGWARKITGKPATAVGGIGLAKDLLSSFQSGSDAEDNLNDVRERLASGEFDLAAVGRALLADHAWARKVRLGEPWLRYDAAAHATKI
jgi:2,4-dienoyl-CoA reductase-like NADH-dependent reductase (Old Yellow Enzyme family)